MNPTVQAIHNIADNIHEVNMESAEIYCSSEKCTWYGSEKECAYKGTCPRCSGNTAYFENPKIGSYHDFGQTFLLIAEAMQTMIPKNDQYYARVENTLGDITSIEVRVIDTSIPRTIKINGKEMDNPHSNVIFGSYNPIYFNNGNWRYIAQVRDLAESMKKFSSKLENLYLETAA